MRTRIHAWGSAALLCVGLVAGCGPGGAPDAAIDSFCALDVEVGASASTFTPLEDGDTAQIVLGFQGFQMLVLDVRFRGARATEADVTGSIELLESTITASDAARGLAVEAAGDAQLVRGYLLFFNDAPLSELQGHDADLTVIVRAGGCVGGARVRVRLSDEAPCIDPMSTIPDVAARDAGALPDGAVLCGAP
ncbi:MAG: hypothetical protein K1X94_23755 [Sandaracinaceae bacterium]|nr:hypothetical protein [Sandaracinaceae bacterium]